jgi:outer membrane protein assembly factor BamA
LAFGQLEINSIEFKGIKKYKTSFLHQFIRTKKGDRLDSALLKKDIQDLLNLRGINECKFFVHSDLGKTTVTIEAKEKITVIPIFNFGTIEDTKWFRLGVVDANFLGREIYLGGYYQYNSRHSVALKSRIPYIKNNKWGALANVTIWRDVEPISFNNQIVQYDYNNLAFEAGVIRHINRKQKIDFSLSYFKENYQKIGSEELQEVPNGNQEEEIVSKIVLRSTKLDYNTQYVTGYSNILNFQLFYPIHGGSPFYIIFNETRYFKHFNKSNIGFRLKLGLATNSTDPFAPFVLDSYINVRGVGNKIDRGTGVITLNSEWRQTVAETSFGVAQLVAFTDIGSWRLPGGGLDDFANIDYFRIFSGGGIRLSYKHAYGATLRIDYGVDLLNPNQGGLVLGVGQYF